MKQVKTIPFTGIQRNKPQGAGGCDNVINMRYDDAGWVPVGPKQDLFPDPGYDEIIIHRMDSYENYIGFKLSTRKVFWYTPSDLTINQEIITLAVNETLADIKFLKRFLLVITDKQIHRFLFKDTTYSEVILTGLEDQFYAALSKDETEVNAYTESTTLRSDNDSPDNMKLSADELLANYYKKLNDRSSVASAMQGGCFMRIALELYDGTEIMQSLPSFYQFGDMGMFLCIDAQSAQFRLKLAETASVMGSIRFFDTPGRAFADIKEFVKNIYIYSSRVCELYDVSDNTITGDNLLKWWQQYIITPGLSGPTEVAVNFSELMPVSKDFKSTIHDSSQWFRIGKVATADMTYSNFINGYLKEIEFDMKEFYSNYATRDKIKIDNYSHQELTGNTSTTYNSRLHLGDTIGKLQAPLSQSFDRGDSDLIQIGGSTQFVNMPFTLPGNSIYLHTDKYVRVPGSLWYAKFQVKLSTADGYKYVTSYGRLPLFVSQDTPNLMLVVLPGLVGYFDNRAVEISLAINAGGGDTYYEVLRKPLRSSLFENFAYLINSNFAADQTNEPAFNETIRSDSNFMCYPIVVDVNTLPNNPDNSKPDSPYIMDHNRIQPSQVDNPFVFPVTSSQQIGSACTILEFGVNTEDISGGGGQFGDFPLIVFTTEGNWAIGIGTGAAYFTNIAPAGGEIIRHTMDGARVIRDKKAKLDLDYGVAYISSEGLNILNGKQKIEISEQVEGLPTAELYNNANFRFYVDNAKLVQLLSHLDGVDFFTYLAGAGLGVNKDFERVEIVVFNPDYPYYYVYDLENKVWTKITGRIKQVISDYPALYGINAANSRVVNISKETAGVVHCLLVTRADTFGTGNVRKKLRRSFIRCQLNTAAGCRAAGYIFQSNNLKEWTRATGHDKGTGIVKDIWITHTPNSARYISFLFVGQLQYSESTLNQVQFIESEFELKQESKLR